jgi:hypothetical protein
MKLLSIIFILAFGLSVFGQLPPEPPLMKGETKESRKASRKEAEKRSKKESKEQAKAEKKFANEKAMANVLDLDVVGLFPQDYADRTVRFKRATLGELNRYTENGETAYFIEVTSPKGDVFYNTINARRLSFIMDENMAKGVYQFYEGNRDTFGKVFYGHLTVEIKPFNIPNGQTIYFAKINCIEFISIFSAKLQTLGNCQQ